LRTSTVVTFGGLAAVVGVFVLPVVVVPVVEAGLAGDGTATELRMNVVLLPTNVGATAVLLVPVAADEEADDVAVAALTAVAAWADAAQASATASARRAVWDGCMCISLESL
jgi:hypothetical protein